MKNFCLLTASSVASALKMKASADGDRYPGEPYRPPYLEKVTKDLSADLNQLIPDSVPEEMNHLLCMFEEYAGSEEWEKLGCDNFLSTTPATPAPKVLEGVRQPGEPDQSCSVHLSGRKNCMTTENGMPSTTSFKWNGFSEV